MMDHSEKTKSQLIRELKTSLARVAELERAEQEHRRARHAPRDSEARLQSVIESAGAGYFRIGADETFQYVNPAWLEMHGYSAPDEVIGQHFSMTQVDSDLDAATRIVARLLEGETIASGEFSRRRKDGSPGYHTFSAAPVVEDGRITGFEGFLVDVSDRKRAEQALRESEERYRDIADNTSDLVWRIDTNGRFTYVSASVESLYGYKPTELTGKSFVILLPEHEVQKAKEMMMRRMGGELGSESIITEFTIRRKDGMELTVESRTGPVYGLDGELTEISGVTRDISDRKEAENLVRIQKELAVALSATSSIDEALAICVEAAIDASGMDAGGVYLVDAATGNLELAFVKGLTSDFAENTSHHNADSPTARLVMAGQPFHCLYTQLDLLLSEEEMKEGLRAISVIPVSHRGAVVACVNVASHTLDVLPQRGRNALEAIGAEIGSTIARLRAEEALRDREATLESIFRAAPTGIGLVCNRILKRVNERLCEVTGYAKDELLDQNTRFLYPTEEEYERVGKDSHGRNGERVRSTLETRWKRKDGEVIDVLLSSTPLDPDDHAQGITFTALDITERKRLGAQLRQSQKLEAVGQLAGGIAHDFNNILQGILGYSEMAMAGLEPEDKRRQDMEEVRKAAERAATLTRQLLAFSRRHVMQPVDMDLNVTIADLIKMLRRVIGEHIELKIIPGSDLETIHADPGMLEQVLMNLCINARDAMESGGTITIATENAVIDKEFCATNPWAAPGRFVRLSVLDTGSGMPSEIIEHIFEPFFTTKETGKGTGLGLAMVYGVIKQHNGLIHCVSDLNSGSTFTIYLPAASSAAESEAERHENPATGGTETILIAEDAEMVRNLAIRILEGKGYTVLAARDGVEAVRLFEENSERITLALLDVVMPRMGGREVYDRIKGIKPGLRVLYSSGYDANAVLSDSGIVGSENLLPKPYGPDGLLRKVREVLDRA